MHSKYANPIFNHAFRKLFATEAHKIIPIDFLNSILELDKEERIKDLVLLDRPQIDENDVVKRNVIDFLAEDQKGHKFIVEVQNSNLSGCEHKAIYHASKEYCATFKVGEGYHVKKVTFVIIAYDIIFPKKSDYKSVYAILDKKSHENDIKSMSWVFLELPKFQKKTRRAE